MSLDVVLLFTHSLSIQTHSLSLHPCHKQHIARFVAEAEEKKMLPKHRFYTFPSSIIRAQDVTIIEERERTRASGTWELKMRVSDGKTIKGWTRMWMSSLIVLISKSSSSSSSSSCSCVYKLPSMTGFLHSTLFTLWMWRILIETIRNLTAFCCYSIDWNLCLEYNFSLLFFLLSLERQNRRKADCCWGWKNREK